MSNLVSSINCRLATMAILSLCAISVCLNSGNVFSQDAQPQEFQLRDLNSYFPFEPPQSLAQWEHRKEKLRQQLKIALGLWPYPVRNKLKPTIHGLIDLGDYTIEKVYFESTNGLYVTGSLYKPKNITGKVPGILSPHGHFPKGRFGGNNEKTIRAEIASGAETFRSNAKSKLQTRSANLAKMGCVVFLVDMIGYGDSQQITYDIAHRFAKQRPDMTNPLGWGLFSPQAESHMQSVMGLQTWNAIRSLDFLESLPEVDPNRIGVTGASGGGTQTFMLCALDDRPAAAFPAVMVSTAMQGGCTCENCSYLRIGTGNVEMAALFAPKPLGLTAANDWTKEMETKGFPELQSLYRLYSKEDNVHLTSRTKFGHNYNQVSREAMYRWFKKHLKFDGDPVETEIEYIEPNRLSVFDADHPRPAGGPDFERLLLGVSALESRKMMTPGLYGATKLNDSESLIGDFVEFVYDKAESTDGELSIGKGVAGKMEGQGAVTHPVNSSLTSRGKVTRTFARIGAEASEVEVLMVSSDGWKVIDKDHAQRPLIEGFRANGWRTWIFESDIAQGDARTQSRRVANNREALAYTIGYNAPQLARRAHAWGSVIGGIDAKKLIVVATDRAALEVVLNAKRLGQAKNVAGIVVNTHGFRFKSITDIRNPDLLPGAAKYFDVPGLLSVAAPTPMLVLGEVEHEADVLKRAYVAAGKRSQLIFAKTMAAEQSELKIISNWIKSIEKK